MKGDRVNEATNAFHTEFGVEHDPKAAMVMCSWSTSRHSPTSTAESPWYMNSGIGSLSIANGHPSARRFINRKYIARPQYLVSKTPKKKTYAMLSFNIPNRGFT